MPEVTETKAQRVERLKREVNAWEHFDKIKEFARTGFPSIPPAGWALIFPPSPIWVSLLSTKVT